MNIKSARIVGVLQDYDLYDNRYDVESVNVDVPLNELKAFTDDEIEEMVEEGCWGTYSDGGKLSELLWKGFENGWFEWYSKWEWEDPCELELEIEEE